MAKIFSWKIGNNKYSYLFPVEGTSYLSLTGRVDNATLLEWAGKAAAMSKEEYEAAFNAMKAQASAYADLENYEYYYDMDLVGGSSSNVLLVAGDSYDEYKGGTSSSSSSEGGIRPAEWVQLNNYIDSKMASVENKVSAMSEDIQRKVIEDATQTISAAISEAVATKEELEEVRSNLSATSISAQDALDKANAAISQGTMTSGAAQEILSGYSETLEWLEAYSGSVSGIVADYDAVAQQLGLGGTAENVAYGLFSKFYTSMNAVSGTVGTVERTMAAASGMIYDAATWYDSSAGTMTELSRTIDASKGYIEDLADYIDSGKTNRLSRKIDAQCATIVDSAKSEFSGAVTSIYRSIDAINSTVSDTITRQDAMSQTLTTMGQNMNAMSGTMTQYMLIAHSAQTVATSFNETWSEASGMVRTVSDLVIDKDEDGIPIYWFYPYDESGETRVYYYEDEENSGNTGFYAQVGGKGGRFEEKKDSSGSTLSDREGNIKYKSPIDGEEGKILPQYSTKMLSYMQQKADEIVMGISSSGKQAALGIKMDSGTNETIIWGLADKVILDSDVLTNSICAKTANFGGVHLEYGGIYADNGDAGEWRIDSAGTFYATNAQIKGAITATSGYFSGELQASTGKIGGLIISDSSISSENGAFSIDSGGTLYAANASLSGSIYATDGIFSGSIYAQNGYFSGTLKATAGTIGGLILSANSIQSSNNKFRVDSDGNLYAINAAIEGSISATSGYFSGELEATSGKVGGLIISNNSLYSENGAFSVDSAGNLTVKNITIENDEYGLNKKYYDDSSSFISSTGAAISETSNEAPSGHSWDLVDKTGATSEEDTASVQAEDFDAEFYKFGISGNQSVEITVKWKLTVDAFCDDTGSSVDAAATDISCNALIKLDSYSYYGSWIGYEHSNNDGESLLDTSFTAESSVTITTTVDDGVHTLRIVNSDMYCNGKLTINGGYNNWPHPWGLKYKFQITSVSINGTLITKGTEMFSNGFGIKSDQYNYFFTNRLTASTDLSTTLEFKSNGSGVTINKTGITIDSDVFVYKNVSAWTATNLKELGINDDIIIYTAGKNAQGIRIPNSSIIPIGKTYKIVNYSETSMPISTTTHDRAAFKRGHDGDTCKIVPTGGTVSTSGARTYEIIRIPETMVSSSACTWLIIEY